VSLQMTLVCILANSMNTHTLYSIENSPVDVRPQ
jgi:hypothetical protein